MLALSLLTNVAIEKGLKAVSATFKNYLIVLFFGFKLLRLIEKLSIGLLIKVVVSGVFHSMLRFFIVLLYDGFKGFKKFLCPRKSSIVFQIISGGNLFQHSYQFIVSWFFFILIAIGLFHQRNEAASFDPTAHLLRCAREFELSYTSLLAIKCRFVDYPFLLKPIS